MHFFSIRIITKDVAKLKAFYERVTGCTARQDNDFFAEIQTEFSYFAIASEASLNFFDGGSELMRTNANQSVALEFRVKDVEQVYEEIKDYLGKLVVQKPKLMPWGNISFLFRDPDGNLINFITPTSPEAIERWGQEDA